VSAEGRGNHFNEHKHTHWDAYDFIGSESNKKLIKIENGGICAMMSLSGLAGNLVGQFKELVKQFEVGKLLLLELRYTSLTCFQRSTANQERTREKKK
jgi:hypothetical protein